MKTLAQRVFEHADAHPHDTAQLVKRRGSWVAIDWLQYATHVRAAASTLVDAGVAHGDAVLVIGDNAPEVVWTMLAVLAVGAVVLPVDPAATASQVAKALRLCGAKHAVVGDLEQIDKLRGLPLARCFVWNARAVVEDFSPTPTLLDFEPSIPAALAQASSCHSPSATEARRAGPSMQAGHDACDAPAFASIDRSSSSPRATTERELVDAAQAALAALQIAPGDRYLCSVPLATEVGRVVGLAMPLLVPLVACFQESPDQVESALAELQPELVMMDAAYWERTASMLERRMRRGVFLQREAGSIVVRRGWREALVQRPLRRQLGLANAKTVLSIGAGRSYEGLEACGVALIAIDGRGAIAGAEARTTPAPATCGEAREVTS